MNNIIPYWIALLCFLPFVAASDNTNHTQPADTILPVDIQRQLQENASALTTLTLRYSQKTEFSDRQRDTRLVEYETTLDKLRFHQRKKRLSDKRQIIEEISLSESSFFLGSVAQNTGLTLANIYDASDPVRSNRWARFPYLAATGFRLPATMSEMSTNWTLKSSVIHHLETGTNASFTQTGSTITVSVEIPDIYLVAVQSIDLKAKKLKLQEANLTISNDNLKIAPLPVDQIIEQIQREQQAPPFRRIEYILKAELGCGIVEWTETTLEGKPIVRVRTEGWSQQGKKKIWFPSRVTEVEYRDGYTSQLRESPFSVTTYALNGVDFTVGPSVFFSLDKSPAYQKPGTIVEDRTSEAARKSPTHSATYTIAADGRHLDGVVLGLLKEKYTWRLRIFMVAFPIIILLPFCKRFLSAGARATRQSDR